MVISAYSVLAQYKLNFWYEYLGKIEAIYEDTSIRGPAGRKQLEGKNLMTLSL